MMLHILVFQKSDVKSKCNQELVKNKITNELDL